MKLILTLILSSILLLGCTDSKENKLTDQVEVPTSTTMSARSVAQKYKISDTKEGHVKCFFEITEKQNGDKNEEKSETIDLVNGQYVFLAAGTTTTTLVKDVHWLRVIANEHKQQPCYVQTLYLTPVADSLPDTSQ